MKIDLTIRATAYQAFNGCPVMIIVQLGKICVPDGNEEGGHTSPHSLIPAEFLAQRHRSVSPSASAIGT